jgi:hypothetical protein
MAEVLALPSLEAVEVRLRAEPPTLREMLDPYQTVATPPMEEQAVDRE